MLSSGSSIRRTEPMAGKGSAERRPPPTVEDLMFERPHIAASEAKELMQLVQESQRARLALAANFESRFEDLVTEGAASGYPALVEQFRPLFAACDATLEALATALAGREGGAAASRLVTSLVREERMRHDAHLKVQVTRQHKSVAGAPDEEEAAEARAALEGAEATEMGYVETIRELLEELTAEAADCED
mmetsp:Transcript_29671/g.94740  ORF Transcript_29671/g.94740 Transcript_29671/m.94740 type:complete len:191 (-) Transcript_29671:300-872(-)